MLCYVKKEGGKKEPEYLRFVCGPNLEWISAIYFSRSILRCCSIKGRFTQSVIQSWRRFDSRDRQRKKRVAKTRTVTLQLKYSCLRKRIQRKHLSRLANMRIYHKVRIFLWTYLKENSMDFTVKLFFQFRTGGASASDEMKNSTRYNGSAIKPLTIE